MGRSAQSARPPGRQIASRGGNRRDSAVDADSRARHAPSPVTDPQAAVDPSDSWESIANNLAQRYPGQKPSILFCLWKLQQNPEASLRDFRDEARMRSIPLAGRSLHSARVLLGLAEPATRRPATPRAAEPDAPPTRPATRPATRSPARPAARPAARPTARPTAKPAAGIEGTLLAAVRRMQSDAGAESERLRAAMRAAITVLERALEA